MPPDSSDLTTLIAQVDAPWPIHLAGEADLSERLARLGPSAQAQARAQRFTGKAGQSLAVIGADGEVAAVLAGGGAGEPALFRTLAARLPAGDYILADGELGEAAAVAWALGGYAFDRYKTDPARPKARLVVASAVVRERALRVARACTLARDMVNTPANDMGPAEIEALARHVAEQHGAQVEVVAGDELLAKGYPAIHAVGRAAARPTGPPA